MNMPELVVDSAAFSRLRAECETIMDTQKRLPDFVFRRPFAKYFAIEHVHLHGWEFGQFLAKLAGVFGDTLVNYMTIIPDPVDYYYRHLSFFGLATFEVQTLVDRYVPVMNRNRSVDSFLHRGGDVGVFWGSSLGWAIACDRISWEMAVVAVSKDVDVPEMSGFACMDAAWISDYMKSQYHWKIETALDFTKRFLANYSPLGSSPKTDST